MTWMVPTGLPMASTMSLGVPSVRASGVPSPSRSMEAEATVTVSPSTSVTPVRTLPLTGVSSVSETGSIVPEGASLTGVTEPKDRVSGAPSSVPSVGTMVRSGTGPL